MSVMIMTIISLYSLTYAASYNAIQEVQVVKAGHKFEKIETAPKLNVRLRDFNWQAE